MESEYRKIKNGKSIEPLNDPINLEEEYLSELNKEEDNLRRKIEQDKEEYEVFIRNVRNYSDSLDGKIDYILKNASKEKYIIKAFEEIIVDELRKNKKISIKLISDYLDLFRENEIKLKKIEELKYEEYQYKELFLLKIAEIEIENIEVGRIEEEYLNEKIKYVLSILEQAELVSEKNGTKLYLVAIYKELSRLYEIDTKIKNNDKARKYLNKAKKIEKEINKNRNRPATRVIHNEVKENNRPLDERRNERVKENNVSKWIKVSVIAIILLLGLNAGLYIVNARKIEDSSIANNSGNEIYSAADSSQYIDSENIEDNQIANDNNEKEVSDKTKENNNDEMSSAPTVKKSLPTRMSEYGDYDSYTQQYFMQMEDLLTEYYTDYEKAVSNSDYSYVRGDLVDDGQLSKELKIAIPKYKNKDVYVKHFSIYNFEMYGEDEASFNLDTVFVVDGKKIQIETQRMTTYYDYYNQRWLIDNYTDWDIIYKQNYNPDTDYFDFTNYRDYF